VGNKGTAVIESVQAAGRFPGGAIFLGLPFSRADTARACALDMADMRAHLQGVPERDGHEKSDRFFDILALLILLPFPTVSHLMVRTMATG